MKIFGHKMCPSPKANINRGLLHQSTPVF